jgi:hypothetical protein
VVGVIDLVSIMCGTETLCYSTQAVCQRPGHSVSDYANECMCFVLLSKRRLSCCDSAVDV